MKSYWVVFLFAILSSCNKEVAEAVTENKAQVTSKAGNSELNESKPTKHNAESQKTRADLLAEKVEAAEIEKESGATTSSYKVHYQSGKEKHNAGDFSGAIAEFSKAIDLNPQYADAYGLRGLSKYKSGNPTDACVDWKQAKQLGYQHAENMIRNYCD